MTIHEDIQKIIDWIKVEKLEEVLNKKRSTFRSGTSTQVPIGPFPDWYWQNLKDQLTEPKAKDLVDRIKALSDIIVEQRERTNQLLWLLAYEGQKQDFEGILNPSPHKPGEEKIYWTKLEEKLKEARDDGKWWGLEGLIDAAIKVKKHLGFSDDELEKLTYDDEPTMPTKKVGGVNTSLTLKETIEICNAFLPHLTPSRSLEKLIDEANRYQSLNIVANNAIREKEEINQKKISALNLDLDTAKNALKKWTDIFPGKILDQVGKEVKELQSRPATGNSGAGTSSSADKQKIADLIKVIEKQNQAIRKYGDAQDNFTGDYSWKAEIIDVSKLKN